MGVSMQFGETGSPRAEKPQILQLWANSDATSNFGAQTVMLSGPIRHYDLILFEFASSTSTAYAWTALFLPTQLLAGSCALSIAGSNNHTGLRTVTAPSDSSLTFSAATFNGATANGNVVPTAIYGIKL